jgi:hypothetical protein
VDEALLVKVVSNVGGAEVDGYRPMDHGGPYLFADVTVDLFVFKTNDEFIFLVDDAAVFPPAVILVFSIITLSQIIDTISRFFIQEIKKSFPISHASILFIAVGIHETTEVGLFGDGFVWFLDQGSRVGVNLEETIDTVRQIDGRDVRREGGQVLFCGDDHVTVYRIDGIGLPVQQKKEGIFILFLD